MSLRAGLGRLNNDPAAAAGCPHINSAEQPHVKAITGTDKQPEKSAWNECIKSNLLLSASAEAAAAL